MREIKKDILLNVIIVIIIVYIYNFYIWPQIFDVNPYQNYNMYKNKLLWINTDKIDVMSEYHKNWCKEIMIEQAPNILACYVDNKYATKQDVLRQIEIFNMMFNFNTKLIYFKYKPSYEIVEFCNKKI